MYVCLQNAPPQCGEGCSDPHAALRDGFMFHVMFSNVSALLERDMTQVVETTFHVSCDVLKRQCSVRKRHDSSHRDIVSCFM